MYRIDNNLIFITLEPNDQVMESLTKIAEELKLTSGWISGIGAIKTVSIGMFDINKKEYNKKDFLDEYELVSFEGNISLKEKKPFVHAHIVFSDKNYLVYAGHLFETIISVAGEFVIHKSNCTINRIMNKTVGLPLWCLSDNE